MAAHSDTRRAARPPGFWIVAAGVAATLAGTFGPWANALAFLSVDGLDVDRGVLTAAAAVVAAILLAVLDRRDYRSRGLALAIGGAGLVALALALWFAIDASTRGDAEILGKSVDVVQAGWGVILSAIGGGAVALGALMATRRGD